MVYQCAKGCPCVTNSPDMAAMGCLHCKGPMVDAESMRDGPTAEEPEAPAATGAADDYVHVGDVRRRADATRDEPNLTIHAMAAGGGVPHCVCVSMEYFADGLRLEIGLPLELPQARKLRKLIDDAVEILQSPPHRQRSRAAPPKRSPSVRTVESPERPGP